MAIAGLLASGAMAGLGSYFSAKATSKEMARQREAEDRRRKNARGYVRGYKYTPYNEEYTPYNVEAYNSPTQENRQGLINQYLSGQLTPAQRNEIAFQRQIGTDQIARTGATRGMPVGGQLALGAQLNRDIALGAGKMAGDQQRLGLELGLPYEQLDENRFYRPQNIAREEKRYGYELGLADYLRQQQSDQKRRELLAQYA